MAQDEKQGFLAGMGVGQEAPFRPNIPRGGGAAADAAAIVRGAGRGPLTQLLGGIGAGIGGLITGEGGRGFKEFGRDFNRGMQGVKDYAIASDMGITVEKLHKRRALDKALQGTLPIGEGSLEDQLKAAAKVASEANRLGLPEVAMRAAQKRTEIEKQIEQQKQAGLETRALTTEVEEGELEADIGIQASVQGKPNLGQGKAVKIDEANIEDFGLPPEALGKMLFLDKDGQPHLVDPVEIVPVGDARKQQLLAKGDQAAFLQIVSANGASGSNIGKLRGTLSDMTQQATILNNISDNFTKMGDPEWLMSGTGKTAQATDKVFKFANNAADIVLEGQQMGKSAEVNTNTDLTWNGKKTNETLIQNQWMNGDGSEQKGNRMLRLLNEVNGGTGQPRAEKLEDMLPDSIKQGLLQAGATVEDVAAAADQYFASVMELAFLDARIYEPANRGLSDKDIIAALTRLAANTANPASFAHRQRVLMKRVRSSIEGIGGTFTIPPGSDYTAEQIRDFVYKKEVRDHALRTVDEAISGMTGVIDQFGGGSIYASERAQAEAQGQPDPLVQKALNGELTDEEISGLTLEQTEQLLNALGSQ
jgi:hypothetical protein